MAEANGASAAVFFGSSPAELLGDQSPFFVPEAAAEIPQQLGRESAMIRKLLPTVYSGPTIVDIETALAMSSKGEGKPAGGRRSPRPAVAVPEKGLINKMENNKYTLRIKCCANGILADDGYKWRKYGQKSIKNSPNPRSYYRCTNPRCSAKKQVERSVEDPDTLVVTYEGLHLHYAYSHFLLPRPHGSSAPPAAAAPDPPAKRTKSEAEAPPLEAEGTYEEATPRAPTPESPAAAAAGPPSPPAAGLINTLVQAPPPPPQQEHVEGREDVPRRPQGLLEDIVPLLVRKPCSDDNTSTATLSSDDPSFSSLAPYSPPTSFSSTSFSWPHSPISTYFDQGVLFGTV